MNLIKRLMLTGMMLGLTMPIQTAVASATNAAPARRLFGGTQPATWLIYAVAPQTLCALNFELSETQKKFLNHELERLPVIGGWNGKGINLETLLTVKPDCIVMTEAGRNGVKRDAVLKKSGIATVIIPLERLEDYPAAFVKLGELTGSSERGRHLAEAFAAMLGRLKTIIAAIPADQRRSVYYACGGDGLETAAGEKNHVRMIAYAGGKNIFESGRLDGRRFKVSLEEVMGKNPEVIIVRDRAFYDAVFTDPRWQSLAAVKSRQVYLIPGAPVNWMDRPPTFMQLLGARWLAGKLYPNRFPEGFQSVAENFYRLFWQTDLTAEKLRLINVADGGECR